MRARNLPSHQRGMGMMQLIFVVGIIIVLAIVALKIVPIYQENMSVMRSLNQVTDIPDVSTMTKSKLQNELMQLLSFNGVSAITPQNYNDYFTIIKNADGRFIHVVYNREAKFVSNLYFMAKFDAMVPL